MTEFQLPEWIGPPVSDEDAWRLVCLFSAAPGAPGCGRPATFHLRMVGVQGASGDEIATSACDWHVGWAREIGFNAEHSTAGSACAMPGAVWIESDPSRCELDDSGVEPVRYAVREMAAECL